MLGQHYLHIDNSREVIRAIISWVVFLVSLAVYCVETDFGSGLMGSKPNNECWQLSPRRVSIICEQELSYQRFLFNFVSLGFCVSRKGKNAVRARALHIISPCVCALDYLCGLVLPVFDWDFLCASLTQFCDVVADILFAARLVFPPDSMNETFETLGHIDAFVHLGSAIARPGWNRYATTCSRWSKFSHTFSIVSLYGHFCR